MSQGYDGLHVVVTGGTGALGRAVVDALHHQGATVYVPWIDSKEVESLPRRDRVKLVQADLADERQAMAFYGGLPPLWASIHVAGGFAMKPVADVGASDFAAMFQLNVMTCFLSSREAVKAIRRGGKGGRIVNVAARPAIYPTGGMIAYAVAKSAVGALTRHLAEEVKAERILVNAVAPGVMDTPANRAAMPGADRTGWAKIEDVAMTIAFLASPANTLVTADVVPLF